MFWRRKMNGSWTAVRDLKNGAWTPVHAWKNERERELVLNFKKRTRTERRSIFSWTSQPLPFIYVARFARCLRSTSSPSFIPISRSGKGWEVHKKIERRSVRVLFLKLRTSSRSRSFFQAWTGVHAPFLRSRTAVHYPFIFLLKKIT